MRRWDMTEKEHGQLMSETRLTRESLSGYIKYLEAKREWRKAKKRWRKRQRAAISEYAGFQAALRRVG